jgi:hypothetical protein
VKYISIFAAMLSLVSAILWLAAARLTIVPMAYPSGPPAEVMKKINWQAKLNAYAAATTGLSVLLQSITLFGSN